jgi:hypothetical protein
MRWVTSRPSSSMVIVGAYFAKRQGLRTFVTTTERQDVPTGRCSCALLEWLWLSGMSLLLPVSFTPCRHRIYKIGTSL